MSLAQTRLDITHNRVVTEKYQTMLRKADDYIQAHLLDIDEVEKRKILVCDHIRKTRIKFVNWTDEQILDRFEKLNEKHEREEELV